MKNNFHFSSQTLNSVLSLVFQHQKSHFSGKSQIWQIKIISDISAVSISGRSIQKLSYQELSWENIQSVLCSDWIILEVTWICELSDDSFICEEYKSVGPFLRYGLVQTSVAQQLISSYWRRHLIQTNPKLFGLKGITYISWHFFPEKPQRHNLESK